MRLLSRNRGFTLTELMVGVAVTSLLFAGIFTASVSLHRSYTAVDRYFSSHMQQIRIMDYFARDVKRSFSVTTSEDLTTVTCIMPDYLIEAGDTEAVGNPSAIGIRRTPVLAESTNFNKSVVDYRAVDRSRSDGVTAILSPTLTSLSANFTSADVGRPLRSANFPPGTTIVSRTDANTVRLSKNATRTGTGVQFSIFADGVRTVLAGQTTQGSTTLTLPADETRYSFAAADVGKTIVGATIASGARIQSYSSTTSVTMSLPATKTGVNQAVTIGGTVVSYTVSDQTITRTEDGVVTSIASSTDSLVPLTTNYLLANTQYAASTVTFEPAFTMNGAAAKRTGTSIFSTAHLRNRRRGN